MTSATFDATDYQGTGPENYEKFFVPVIGAPLATDFVAAASLQPGERVLDVACGTGVVARLAAREVGQPGAVAGLDLNPSMLAVARAVTPPALAIDWYETSAEAMPLRDDAFDVVLCQMGLQFVPDKRRALAEMRRIVSPGGRVLLSLAGPTPPLFGELRDVLAEQIDPACAGFVDVVFSLHEPADLRALMADAGFAEVDVTRTRRLLRLPAPEDFLWQYVHSTPLGALVAQAREDQRNAVEREVLARWRQRVVDGGMNMEVGLTTVLGQI